MPMTFTGAGWNNWTGQWAPGTLAGTKDPNPPIALNNTPIVLVQSATHVNANTFRDQIVSGWQARTLLQAFTYKAYVGTSLDGLDAFGNVDSITTSFDSDVWGTPQTFYGPTVTSVTGLTVIPSLLTNSQAFFTHSLRRTLKPSLHTNSQTFFSPKLLSTVKPSAVASTTQTLNATIRRTLKPANLANAQSFFTQKILATVKPTALSNGQTFFSAKLLMTLKPTLLSDGDTFYTHTITTPAAGTVAPSLLVNSQTFFSQTLRVTLKPSLHTNSQAFFTTTLRSTLKPALASNTQSFFSPKLLIRISPAAYANSQTFRSVTVSAGAVLPPLYVNTQQFYGPTVSSVRVVAGDPWGPVGKRKKKRVIPYEAPGETDAETQVPRPAASQAGERATPPAALPADQIAKALLQSQARVTPKSVTTTVPIDTALWSEVYGAIARGEERRRLEAEMAAEERRLAEQWFFDQATALAREWVDEHAPKGEAAFDEYMKQRRKRELDEERFLILAAWELLK